MLFTVTLSVLKHPLALLKYVMVAVPALIPNTNPPDTVATDVLLLLQVPPAVASANVVLLPVQIVLVPVIAAMGFAFTVTGCVTEQPALL